MAFQDLITLCQGRNIWIQTHNFPDPDAIGSAFALQNLLQHCGISTKLCYEGAIDKLSSTKMLNLLDIQMYSHDEIRGQLQPEDMIILVDCQKNTGNTTDFVGEELAVVDHHPTRTEVSYEYKDIRITGSCASIIASYYQELGLVPSDKTATALLYGLRMDTLQFSRGVTAFDVDMFRFLFPFVNQDMMTRLETNNMEFEDLQAYGVSIKNTRIYGKVGFSHIDYSCPDALVAILCDFLLSLIEVEVAIVYSKREDGYKFSIRSERADVDAGALARAGLCEWGNGGGHAFMAGGMIRKDAVPGDDKMVFHAVQSRFISIIEEQYPQALEA
ncbi:MAG: DHHA1 domain-containing protein [Oscillospiraceae bacterium]|nr:DHHA1 domain-containing protein [Oscillospiraceae bacterium]